jgi:hypothetical protein
LMEVISVPTMSCDNDYNESLVEGANRRVLNYCVPAGRRLSA